MLDSEKNVKLIDFGFSTQWSENKKRKLQIGSPSYHSPQIAKDEAYAGPPADIWATGVLLYTLINGVHPFVANDDTDLDS